MTSAPDTGNGQDAARLFVADGQQPSGFDASLGYFLGPLAELLADDDVSEIMINGPEAVYVERGGRIERTRIRFRSERKLLALARNIAQYVGHQIDDEHPLMDGRLPDGSRVCVVLGAVTGSGTSVNIRRFHAAAASPDFLLQRQAISTEAMELVLLAVKAHQNVIVSGGTGSGKTTLLNVLSTAFSDAERIIVIEDTRELQIQQQHVVQLTARPADAFGRGQVTIRDLFVSSLRMRPDRIIVGEVRRGEALDMVQAMTSGHRGSLATLHASTPFDTCRRLETMALLAEVSIPLFALRSQIASAIDLVVQTNRVHDGRRLITHISEIDFDEAEQAYLVHDLYHIDPARPRAGLTWTGRRPRFADELAWHGLAEQAELTRQVLGLEERAS